MKRYNLELSEENAKKIIGNIVSSSCKNREDIINGIFEIAQYKSDGIDVLVSVIMGFYEKPKYKRNDVVWVLFDSIYISASYSLDHNKTKASGLCDDTYFKCKIVDVHPYSKYQYKVLVCFVNTSNENREIETWIQSSNIYDISDVSKEHINMGDLI